MTAAVDGAVGRRPEGRPARNTCCAKGETSAARLAAARIREWAEEAPATETAWKQIQFQLIDEMENVAHVISALNETPTVASIRSGMVRTL